MGHRGHLGRQSDSWSGRDLQAQQGVWALLQVGGNRYHPTERHNLIPVDLLLLIIQLCAKGMRCLLGIKCRLKTRLASLSCGDWVANEWKPEAPR